MTHIPVWLDIDRNGTVDAGDELVGTATYSRDDETLEFTPDQPLTVAARDTATLLVTYDLAGDSQSPDESKASSGSGNDAVGTPSTSVRPVLGLLLLPSMLLLGAVGTRQGRVSQRVCRSIGITAVLLTAAMWFPGCGGGDDVVGPGPGPSDKTFQVALVGIGAQESGSVDDASVDDLSILGTILTVGQ